MIEINYKILFKNSFLGEEEVLKLLSADKDKFIEELFDDNWKGHYGSIHIRFFDHEFVVDSETIWSILFKVQSSGIEKLLSGQNNYHCDFESLETDYLTMDFIDSLDTGIRIRLYGKKSYKNSKGKSIYISRTDYMKQEIILPKVGIHGKVIILCRSVYSLSGIT